jgi:hypothetical protein
VRDGRPNDYALEHCELMTRQVFNIEVDGSHTYYVGEAGVRLQDASD